MARLVWAVFCQQALVDRFSNALSIINVLEEVHVIRPPEVTGKNVKPAVQMQCAVVSLWERDEPSTVESGRVRLRLISPDGKKLLDAFQQLDLATHRRTRLIAELPIVPVAGEGIYRIELHAGTGEVLRKAGSIGYELHYREPLLPKSAG
jgi:hypothetical protein